MDVTIMLEQAQSYHYTDEMGQTFKFVIGKPQQVPMNVAAVLLSRMKGRSRLFNQVLDTGKGKVPQVELPGKKHALTRPNVPIGMRHEVASKAEVVKAKGMVVPEGGVDLDSLRGKKVLIVRQGGIGDILFCTPIIRFLYEVKGLVPDMGVDGAFSILLSKNPYIKEVLNISQVKAVKSHYAQVFNLTGGIEANKVAEKEHCVDAMARWVGITEPIKNKELVLSATQGSITTAARLLKEVGIDKNMDKVVGIAVSASARIRTWPLDYINDLVDRLLEEKGVKVVLVGKLTEGLEGLHSTDERVLNCVNSTSLAQVIGLIKLMKAFVGPDSGLLWIAQALKVNSVGLFGPFHSSLRITPGGSVVPIDAEGIPCGPCGFHDSSMCDAQDSNGNSNCMLSISPEVVLERTKELLS